jgi:hypothetical protein
MQHHLFLLLALTFILLHEMDALPWFVSSRTKQRTKRWFVETRTMDVDKK